MDSPAGRRFTDGITLTNKVAYVGTWMDDGNIYVFDYNSPAHPRMTLIKPEGGAVCESVLTLQNNGTDLFSGGYLAGAPVMDTDLSQPRNVVNYYPYFAKSITSTSPVLRLSGERCRAGGRATPSYTSAMQPAEKAAPVIRLSFHLPLRE